ncbi:MAG: HlyD family efflux transporter periplasmic adaptor subunit [Anaerolineae bacterium]|jgi:multidrug efflux pump subunit AcrA (membrane-fusion protein)|nr:HlyD family efflux transporter periplasmic adaptor subunit [Anaerolineae bacterium]MBT7988409.1 HlyD family efflux transporter periplasmic adaptor subunit [Anaerolineae bacterium]
MFSKFFANKKMVWITVAVISLLAVGGFYAFQNAQADADVADAPAMQTAKVRQGDLVLYASGVGSLVPAAEASFGFRSSGQLLSLSVAVGDSVEVGDLLAELDNTAEKIKLQLAERTLAEITSPASVAAAEQALALSERNLSDAEKSLAYQISWSVLNSEEKVAEAEEALLLAKESNDEEKIAAAEAALASAERVLAGNWDYYENHYIPENFKVAATRSTPSYIAIPTEFDILEARAAYAIAKAQVTEAKDYLAVINGDEIPDGATGSSLKALEQAQLDLLSAQDSLDATRLYAPISGMVMSINANVGDTLGTSVIMTIATPDDLVARVYMDETDLDNATVGNKTLLTFDAFPDIVVAGEIIMVEQALQTVDGTPVVVSWATFENEANLSILSGMTVDVEIIGGEALGALLVPIQALREIAPGSYAVFIVDADGSLKLTPVTVGLRDFANAEILTGVEAGDIVSTGVVETK